MLGDEVPRTYVVLLVDDDLRTTRRLADMLREDGLAVDIARDGAAAVARFAQAPVPDALVTELNTAHVDAAAVSRFARTQRPGLPVFVVTGYPNLFRPDAFSGAAPLLFTKPFDYSKLKDALLEALQPNSSSLPASTLEIADASRLGLEFHANNAAVLPGNTLPGAQALRALRRS
jgi:CheY-like chemotaxis protein